MVGGDAFPLLKKTFPFFRKVRVLKEGEKQVKNPAIYANFAWPNSHLRCRISWTLFANLKKKKYERKKSTLFHKWK